MKKRILVAPLNWGLGHATRCIPIINDLQKQGVEVIIASDGRSSLLLKKEFPNLVHLDLPSYNINYQGGNLIFSMAIQLPKIFSAINKEHLELENIISEHKIDAVISDNRYGMWNKKTPSIFITHQLFIHLPKPISFLSPIVNYLNHRFIKKFDECWIPDFPNENNLSGKLSHKINTTFPLTFRASAVREAYFIGTLSRFRKIENAKKKYDLLIILSGPEPQRTIFEKLIQSQITNIKSKILLVRGITEENEREIINENIEMVSFLNSSDLNQAINNSDLILSRTGYSTIMDLAELEKKAILIPTPGQTEQEYLAEELKRKKIFYSEKQNEFDLKRAISESKNYQGIKWKEENGSSLSENILRLLRSIKN